MPVGVAEAYEELGEPEFRVLRVIEGLLPRYEYVPVEVIERRAGLPPSRLARALDRLGELKLVRRRLGGLIGYTLTYLGLDVLALRGLVVRGVVARLGAEIGVGKEGRVYLAETPAGTLAVVKFHREGRRSFKHLRRTRSSMAEAPRGMWLVKAKALAEREFKVLAELRGRGALVPAPLGWNRNAVVQEYIEGVELYRLRDLDPRDAERVLLDVLETLRKAYVEVGVVHGDLSEYNVLVSLGEGEPRGYVIDWPQYVYRDEPHADQLLERDVLYIVRFFRRRFGVEPLSVEEALGYVRGASPGLGRGW